MNHRVSCPVSQIRVKTPIFILNFPEYPCIRDSGMNFQPVMYNSRGGPERFLLRLVVTAHLVQVKFIERGAERLPVKKLLSPAVPHMMGNEEVRAEAEALAYETLQREIGKRIEQLTGAKA